MTPKTALELGRVSNLPTVWTNVLAGVVVAGGSLRPDRVAVLMVSVSLAYVAGMYLNDAFDRDIDAIERPERPIPSGRVSARTVFACGFAMLLASLAMLAWLGMAPLAAGVALAVAIVVYDVHHKNNVFGPVVMGLCRALVYFVAGASVAPAPTLALVLAAAVMLSYVVGLTALAKQGELTKFRHMSPLILLAAPIGYGVLHGAWVMSLVLAAWVSWCLCVQVISRRIPQAVGGMIAGIALVDAVIIAGEGRFVVAMLAVCGLFATKFLQRFIQGT